MAREQKKPVKLANTALPNQRKSARYLRLVFEDDPPLLYSIEFRYNEKFPAISYKRGDQKNPLDWREVESAISLCFLKYIEWNLGKNSGPFLFGKDESEKPFVKTLSGAIYQPTHHIHNLFYGENPKSRNNEPIVTHSVFPTVPGISKSGKSRNLPFCIPVDPKFLPSESVEIFWTHRTADRLTKIKDIQELAGRIGSHYISNRSRNSTKKNLHHIASKANSQPPPHQIEPLPKTTEINVPIPKTTIPPKTKWSYGDEILAIGEAYQQTKLSLYDVCAGTLIFGDDDSKKRTTSGATFLKAFLENNFGGLILTSEKGEGKQWVEFCKSLGREDDIQWIRYGGPFKIDLLESAKNFDQSNRWASAWELMEMTYACFFALANSCKEDRRRKHLDHLKKFLWYHLSPLLVKRPDLRLINLRMRHFFKWEGYYSPGKILRSGIFEQPKTKEDALLLNDIKSFWENEFPSWHFQTKSPCMSLYEKAANICRTKYIYDLIAHGSNFSPASTMDGKIIILDFPLSEWRSAGVFLQTAIKYIFLRGLYAQKREDDNSRPVFLWENNGENFLSDIDLEFENSYGLFCSIGKGRDVRLARIFLTKGKTAFCKHFGGDFEAKQIYDGLANCFQTVIYHRNQDTEMNQDVASFYANHVRADDITADGIERLRNGGPVNNYESDAIITEQVWRGFNVARATFKEIL